MQLNCSILIVDDSEADRVTYRRYLEPCDGLSCYIFECDSAESALKFCDRGVPDVILLDYLLPDADGLELLQDLAETMVTLPSVIMLTGQGNEAVAVAAMKHGVRDYLVKGQLTQQKLIYAVANALAEQRLQIQLSRQQQQQQLLTQVALDIYRTIELPQILQAAVVGARQLLGCDRALIYCLQGEPSHRVVAESVLPPWSAALGGLIEDNCFLGDQAQQLEKYAQGHKVIITNVETTALTPCYRQLLKQFQVKAVLAVPIIYHVDDADRMVWGLLIAHHCQTSYEWKSDEVTLLDQLSTQIAIAIQQSELVHNLKTALQKHQTTEQQLRQNLVETESTNLRLNQISQLLAKRNQELDEFSYVVSHDLQAPLRGINNLAEWLSSDLEGQIPAENQQQLELIQLQVRRMNALIRGLLEYARVGKQQSTIESVNLSQLVQEVVELLMPPATFAVQFSPTLPTLEVPAVLLKQVLANLISNAIKYHDRADGKVEISVIEHELEWQFTIADDGPGIARAQHERIFGIFQTVNANDPKGTGLGLAIVKKIVEDQGGTVWLESALNQGSRFFFTWPKTP